ncbi:MAG: signal peptidase I [Chloroflexi bacterium]|nr:signal peptidase I [Chloroflexota bacterium]
MSRTPTLPPSFAPEGSPPDQPITSIWPLIKTWLRDILETVLPALFIVVLVNAFLAQATRVEGQSMQPSLHSDERLVIEKLSYHLHPPQRGDIIVLRLTDRSTNPLIKRVIGLPGETVEIRDGRVYINGQVLEEPYVIQPASGSMPPRVVPPGHVFVLGDNRDYSNDSRTFGEVPLENVLGRAWFRYWPLNEIGFVR